MYYEGKITVKFSKFYAKDCDDLYRAIEQSLPSWVDDFEMVIEEQEKDLGIDEDFEYDQKREEELFNDLEEYLNENIDVLIGDEQ